MSLNDNASSFIWTNYLDLANDVYPYLQIPNDGSFTRGLDLQLVTDYVCQESQQIMGKPIAAQEFFYRFDGWSGWNGAYIMLPWYPVLQINEVTEFWGASGPHILEEATPENQVDGFAINYRLGQLIRVFPGNIAKPWFPGVRSIEVTWTAGYNPVPARFKVPALEIIKEWWTTTQQVSRSGPLPAGYEGINEADTTYAGLARRVRSAFFSEAQVGIG